MKYGYPGIDVLSGKVDFCNFNEGSIIVRSTYTAANDF